MPKPTATPTPDPAPRRGVASRRGRSFLRGSALVVAGMLIAAAFGGTLMLGGFRYDGGWLIRAAMSTADLLDACRAPLMRRLTDKGFQPDDVEFGPEPSVGSPWARERSLGDSFTFRDGAAGERVDGVVACLVSEKGATAEFRVASTPHRAA